MVNRSIATLSLCFIAAALLHSSSAFCVYNYGAQTIAVMDAGPADGDQISKPGFFDFSIFGSGADDDGLAIKPNDKTVSMQQCSSQYPLHDDVIIQSMRGLRVTDAW